MCAGNSGARLTEGGASCILTLKLRLILNQGRAWPDNGMDSPDGYDSGAKRRHAHTCTVKKAAKRKGIL